MRMPSPKGIDFFLRGCYAYLMKQADLKEKSSVFFMGRGIIVLVVSGIALGFLLGFFVGKITPATRP